MADKYYVACDLGAESGRVILGSLADGKVQLEEIHRFPTGAIRLKGSLRWNLVGIFEELKKGLSKVAERGVLVASLSVDSWGVDYALSNDRQPLLSVPYQYRDSRTENTFEATVDKIGRDKIFAETGIQFMSLNTLYQLVADMQCNSDVLSTADKFLNIADQLNYWFSGVASAEVSLASTTQLYNPVIGDWSKELIGGLDLPAHIFPKVVASGTKLGTLADDIQSETGVSAATVIAGCSHDTASAVAAVPAEGEDWAFLSSGTWSLLGVELPQPVISGASLAANFSNEAGYGGTTRFLKNIVGLWLLQESRRVWTKQGNELDYAEINRLAEQAEPFRSLINPDDPRFLSPDDMTIAIAEFCRETNQPVPETPGQYARCILESLALLYGQVISTIEQLTNRTIRRLHIVGGGSQSQLLNQLAASATARTVLAGPVEATAIGNVLIQAIAMGDLPSIEALREVVRNSFSIESFSPESSTAWDDARERFSKLTDR